MILIFVVVLSGAISVPRHPFSPASLAFVSFHPRRGSRPDPRPVAADVAPTARKKYCRYFPHRSFLPFPSPSPSPSLLPSPRSAASCSALFSLAINVSRRRRRRRISRRRRRRRGGRRRVVVPGGGGERAGAGAVGPDPPAPLPAGPPRRARRLHAPGRHRAPPQVRLPR